MSQNTPEGNPKVLKISGYVLGLMGIALVVFGVYFIALAMDSVNWTKADATVAASAVKWSYIDNGRRGVKSESDKQYYYEVTYNYTVNDIPYTSRRYSLGSGFTASGMFNDRADAEAERKELYPQGKGISIYYNPEDPTAAVISKGIQWSTLVPLLLGLFFAGTAYLLIRAAKMIKVNDSSSVSF
ncbi:MAG: DUF3592 domain-containing protein [Bdellovibrionales bacterium]|nr:DUF3592 domain-containing protein [Bdellovibrionales bacterium]